MPGVDDAPETASRDRFVVTREPLDLGGLIAQLADPAFGALATFVGTVRSPNRGKRVRFIDYEGYEAMMTTQMARVAAELRERHAVGAVAIAHRLGRLEPGAASIAVVVASPHRAAALAACREGIDRCKELLPVWKYEVDDDGGGWVVGSTGAAEPL